MRLLNIDSLRFAEFHDDDRPGYVAASHRWLGNDEATFQDVRDRRNTDSKGYQKVKAFAQYIQQNLSSIRWLWIDTCCINKDSAAELSESINSMFEWYRDASLCVAYLADVETIEGRDGFETSEWFKRGWTLQELLAPSTVIFVTKTWQVIGHKGGTVGNASKGPNLGKQIARVTGIPEQVLYDYGASFSLSVDEKLQWMNGRTTTRPEDMSYALYGILGVTLGANYGEKHDGARGRLLTAIYQRENATVQQADQFRRIADWFSPPDPWTNHETARQRHEPQTGTWLLQHNQYQAWKSGSIRCLWLHGKAGCGKTVLGSTAIEDVRVHCKLKPKSGQAIFYFTFSDNQKQSYENLVRSLVVQLGWKEPGLSKLRQVYERPGRTLPGLDELQEILLSCTASYDEVFLHLDAIDECPESDGIRRHVLERVEGLLSRTQNVRMLVTSRDLLDIRHLMDSLGADFMRVAAQTVSADIQKYVAAQLSRDPKLSRLDPATRTLIEETLSQKANGMFRWVYCQLQELKKSKSTRPRSVRAALLSLPETLDDTYEHMLTSIHENDRLDALTLLRWLAFASKPPSLDELAEASIVDPADDPTVDGFVDTENRGDWRDALEILAGLVTIDDRDMDSDIIRQNAVDNRMNDPGTTHVGQPIDKQTTVVLAHFSVKEYLVSRRILDTDAKYFYLDPAREHRFLAQSCLVYLAHYSGSPQKTHTGKDLETFPLLNYAARSWYYHASLQGHGDSIREVHFLTSTSYKTDWLSVYNPDDSGRVRGKGRRKIVGTALYYASEFGLETVVRELLSVGVDVNAQCGRLGSALQVASLEGHERVVQVLIDAGADINAQGGWRGSALQAASSAGHKRLVQVLIDAGADINAQGGWRGSALQAASLAGHERVMQVLIDAGADVNAQGGQLGSALQATSLAGHERVVQVLIDAGADVNAQGGWGGNALQTASLAGHERVVQVLIDAEADVNAQGGWPRSALQLALDEKHEKIVQMLLDAGASE